MAVTFDVAGTGIRLQRGDATLRGASQVAGAPMHAAAE